MKKRRIAYLIVCLFLLINVSGCKKNTETPDASVTIKEVSNNDKSLWFNKIKQVFSDKISNELITKDIVSKLEIDDNSYVISFANDKDNPTLRLDFAFNHDNELIQYVSKGYGYVDEMEYDKIDQATAITLVTNFAKVFINQDVTLKESTPISGYEDDNYVTFVDQNGNQYLVQLDKNIVLKFIVSD